MGHQWVISGSSVGHQWVISQSSVSHQSVISQSSGISSAHLLSNLCLIAAGLVILGLVPAAAAADPASPAASSIPLLVGGLALIGAGVALVDTPAIPLLASLADSTLGDGVGYGAAAAVEATSMSMGQLIGPLLALPFNAIDTGGTPPWLKVGLAPAAFATAACCLLCAPLVPWVLRHEASRPSAPQTQPAATLPAEVKISGLGSVN